MRKRLWSILLVLCMMLSLLPVGATAANSDQGLDYYLESDGGAAVCCDYEDRSKLSGVLTIPSKIDGYPVTSIGEAGFAECTNLTEVIIPEGVTTLSHMPFYGCTKLKRVSLPSTLKYIGPEAFRFCEQLEQITIPNGVEEIGSSAFYGCKKLKSIRLPGSVNYIGSNAFTETGFWENENNWKNGLLYIDLALVEARDTITKAEIKQGTTVLASFIFSDCTNLTSAVIPSGVEAIPDGAFYNCTSLTRVTIPVSVKTLNRSAFNNCSALKDVYFGGTRQHWNKIKIDKYGNDPLTKLTEKIHFESNGPEGDESSPVPTTKPTFSVPSKNIYLKEKQDVVMVKATLPYSDAAYLKSCMEMIDVSTADKKMKTAQRIVVAEDGKTAELIFTLDPNAAQKAQYNIWWDPEGLGGETVFVYGNKSESDDTNLKSSGFLTSRDGWCVKNASETFGYSDDYMIPVERFGIFSSWNPLKNLGSETLYLKFRKWGGSCFGMALLSAAQYCGLVDLSVYSMAGSGDSLSSFGYTNIATDSNGKKYYSLEKDSALIATVESAHISQFSDEFAASEVFQGDSHYTKLLSYLESESAPLLISLETYEGIKPIGHTIVADTIHRPVHIDDSSNWGPGWYGIYVYDSNAPQNGASLANPKSWYDRTSYLYVNTINGKWKLLCVDNDGNTVYKMENDYSFMGHQYIKFNDISKLKKNYFTSKLHASAIKTLFFNSRDITLENADETLISIKNDKLKKLSDNFDYKPIYSFSENDNSEMIRYSDYSGDMISYTSPNASVLFADENNSIVVSNVGSCKITSDLRNSTLSIVTISDTVFTAELDCGTTSYVINHVSAEKGDIIKIAEKNNQLRIESEKGAIFDVDTYNNGKRVDQERIVVIGDDTIKPSTSPTAQPTTAPTAQPTAKPSPEPSAKPVSTKFVDVADNAYYADAVKWAVEHDPVITNGVDSTHFAPNRDCTRAQMVTFLWRAAGEPKPESTRNPFTDVKKGAYYYDAVLWAVEQGITTGTGKNTFSPDATVTRAQTVTFLWRMEGQPEVKVKNPFKDTKSGQYYYDAVLWAVENEITTGTSATTFAPNDPCTRAQIVTFLYRDLG